MISLNRTECKDLPAIDLDSKYDAARYVKENDGLYLEVIKNGKKYASKIPSIQAGENIVRRII
jgi:hypothetical protein